jgi:hypothetical protein
MNVILSFVDRWAQLFDVVQQAGPFDYVLVPFIHLFKLLFSHCTEYDA